MTCIVAAKENGKTVIGADSCTTVGDKKLVNMVNGSKLVRFDSFIVGLSGTGPLKEILDSMLAGSPCTCEETCECVSWRDFPIESTLDVVKFLDKFMEIYQERGDAESMESVELLLITADKIFCTMGESTVFEVGDFWAVGSGSDYALGVMETFRIMHPRHDRRAAVHQAIEIACKYSSGCEPPVEIATL